MNDTKISIKSLRQNKNFTFSLAHGFYVGFDGKSDVKPKDSSNDGAYTFSPTTEDPFFYNIKAKRSKIWKGNLINVP